MKTKLTEFMTEIGITQEELAKSLNITRETISHYCTGGNVTYKRAIELSAYINIARTAKIKRLKKRANYTDFIKTNIIGD